VPRFLIPLSNALATLLFALAERVEDAARHLRRCPDCGRSRYYGRPCV
jgi:hypothetical protein